MFKRGVSKRALVQADWVISFGIFIMYIVWFFIAARPLLDTTDVRALPLDDTKENFLKNASWQINVTPIILKSNQTIQNLPIIMDYPFSGPTTYYGMRDRYWSVYNNKLFFLASFPAKKQMVYWYNSDENYSKPALNGIFVSEEDFTETNDMNAEFENSLPDIVRIDSVRRIRSYNLKADSTPFTPDRTIHYSDSILAAYTAESNKLNHTSYILINNSRVYNYLEGDDQHVTITMELDRYPRFHIDSLQGGLIDYNDSECNNFETDYINFFDNDEGIAMVFDEDSTVMMCHKNTLDITIEKDLSTDFNYNFIFHDEGGDVSYLKNEYTAEYGLRNTFTGISIRNLNTLETVNYSLAKQQWSNSYDLNISVLSSSNNKLFDIGTDPSSFDDVESRSYYLWSLDKYGNQSRVMLNVLLWK